MKKFRFLAVMALLMMFGCSKDEVITDEQELFSVEKNSQPVIGEKNGLDNPGWKDISFQLTSINNSIYEGNCMPNNRKILKSGYFEGNIQGFGVIKSNLSKYEFSEYCVEDEIGSNSPTYGEQWRYELKIIGGKVAISTKDYFYLDITGYLYPWFNLGTGIDDGTFIGTATTRDGSGKFKDFNDRTFVVGKYGFEGINLETGMIHWWMH
ncbi:MAG: hypothetical protein ACYCZ2_16240 [Lutibacter sp.]|nr:MAG: hypothetical protein APF83_13120 [Lutibacter sp. BRH_c52]HCE56063.1 hypothetical protein [Lutibacter sp.]